MSSESNRLKLINDAVQEFHAGDRFKTLAEKKGKQSPTYWVKILGVKDRSSVYHRWQQKDINSKELLLICAELGVSVEEFFQFPAELLPRPANKTYIEDDIERIKTKLKSIEERLMAYSNR